MRATAQASAHAALQKAQAEMKAEAERQGHAVAAKLGQQTEEAETRIAAAKSAALAGLESTVKEVVAAATEKLIGVKAGDQEGARAVGSVMGGKRSEEHTSELQSLMRITYAVFCLKNKKDRKTTSKHSKQ